MAKVPSSKKRLVRAVKPVAAAPAKPVAKTPAVAKTAVPKPVAAKPAVVAKPPVAAKPVMAPKPVVAAQPAPVPVVAKAAVPAPVAKPVEGKPVTVTPPVQTETKPAPAPKAAAAVKETIMTDTITKVQETIKSTTEEATAKATAFFTDASGRAKDAMAKGSKTVEEMVEFSKGNLEAMVASGRVAAKGAEEIAKYSAEYGRTTIEKANATAKQFAAVKSPTEFFQLQGDVAKQTLDSIVAEGSKFTESYLKLLGDVFQPIQNRVAVAVEKVKTSVAA